jgi:hypothetical protein
MQVETFLAIERRVKKSANQKEKHKLELQEEIPRAKCTVNEE